MNNVIKLLEQQKSMRKVLVQCIDQTQYHKQQTPIFNDPYSRNDLYKIKVESYVINLDEYKSVRNNCIALYVNGDNFLRLNTFLKK